MSGRRGLRAVVVPALFLIFWLAVCFAALLRLVREPGENGWAAMLVVLGVGGFGAYGLGRSVIRAFRAWDRGG